MASTYVSRDSDVPHPANGVEAIYGYLPVSLLSSAMISFTIVFVESERHKNMYAIFLETKRYIPFLQHACAQRQRPPNSVHGGARFKILTHLAVIMVRISMTLLKCLKKC